MITRTAAELAHLCGATLEGDGERRFVGPASLVEAGPDEVSFLANPRYLTQLGGTRAGCLVVPAVVPAETEAAVRDRLPREVVLLLSANPNRAFSRIIESFLPETERPPVGIHPSAVVAAGASVDGAACIGPRCVVGDGARLERGVVLHPGVVVGPRATVGEETVLHPGVVLYAGVRVGRRCLLHAGVVIGSDGFGFEPVDGRWEKVPQCGTVVLGDDVEIGANSTVDRGRFGPTRIGDGVKLDNLVQIAHNVVLDEGVVVAAQAGVAGSTRVGRGAMLGGQVGIAGHLDIGPGARVAAQSGIGHDLEPGKDYFGSPAREKSEAFRMLAVYPKLPDMLRRLKQLERRIAELTGSEESGT